MDNHQIAKRYVDAVMAADPQRMAEVVCDDVEVQYPQSGEVIRGRDNYLAVLENYPGGLAGTVDMELSGASREVSVVRPAPFSMPQITVSGSGNLFVAEGVATYPDGGVYYVAMIMHFEGGEVRRETWYFGEPFEAPAWREPFTE